MKVKELYEYVSKLMEENKGESEVKVQLTARDYAFRLLDECPTAFEMDIFWFNVDDRSL